MSHSQSQVVFVPDPVEDKSRCGPDHSSGAFLEVSSIELSLCVVCSSSDSEQIVEDGKVPQEP